MTEFTPIAGLIGGLLIGLSAVLLLIFSGRIAGISGIFNGFIDGLLGQSREDFWWRFMFIVGLVIGPLLTTSFNYSLPSHIELSWIEIIAGGLLVGFGTNLANGCTSGHGVCGIGRFSIRSLVATFIFIGIAMLTVWVIQQWFGGKL